jgi:hypothetical protein
VYETEAELTALDHLLARSRAGASEHLRSIIDDTHAADARVVVGWCTGMRVITLATVTEWGEPRISALDGHFLHGTWIFATSGASAKARHLQARPAVSTAYVDGERFAVFAHGRAVWMRPSDPAHDPAVEHWTGHYGSSPYALGPDIRIYRLEPSWMVAYRIPGAEDRETSRWDPKRKL